MIKIIEQWIEIILEYDHNLKVRFRIFASTIRLTRFYTRGRPSKLHINGIKLI